MESPRTLGEKLAISIATAEALEKIAVEKIPVDNLWVNIRTLFRNYYGSFDEPSSVPPGTLVKGFIEEALVIQELLHGVLRVTYYVTDTRSLVGIMPHAKFKVPTTPGQKIVANAERLCVSGIVNEEGIDLVECKQLLPGKNANAYIMTHFPLDLMSRYEFGIFELLESHTGEIKKPIEFIKKLTKNEKYHKLPFNLLTIQVLGDRSVQFSANAGVYRKNLLQLAESNRWNPATTKAKVLSDIGKLTDVPLARVMKDMLNARLR